jgi:SAM-dependent methyltransferase
MSKDTSWGKVADWYDDLVTDPDSYQTAVILPNVMRVLALKEGERVCDIGCGQGFFSRAVVASGATVLGVDISAELIALAEKRMHEGLSYRVLSAEKLEGILEASFDTVLCVLALQNMRDSSSALSEMSRILKPGGRAVVVLNHPCFRIPKRSSWGFDESSGIQYRRIDGYLSETVVDIDMEPGKGGAGVHTVSFHRPLQLYVKQCVKQGLMVRRLEEWNSHRESQLGPRQLAEDTARREIPLFLCLELFKK